MPLNSLNLYGSAVTDLKPIKGAPILRLNIGGVTPVHDLSPLQNMKIEVLRLGQSSLTDLSPIRNLTLKALDLPSRPKLSPQALDILLHLQKKGTVITLNGHRHKID